MTKAQQMYLDPDQRSFALNYKDLAEFLKIEINMIHEIQLISYELYQIDKSQSKKDKNELLKNLELLKLRYQKEYGPYEIEHYSMIPSRSSDSQLTLF